MKRTLSVKDIAKELEQGRRTIMRWVSAGCPHNKGHGLRGSLTFNRQEVVEWMRRVGATGAQGRPPMGAEIDRSESARTSTSTSTTRPASKVDISEIQRLTRLVNLQIKKLEAQKRLERAADGELAPVADFQRYWNSRVDMLHAQLRVIPERIARVAGGAGKCGGCGLQRDESYDDVFDAARKEIDQALQVFAGEIPW